MAGAYAVVSGGVLNRVSPHLIGDVARLAALAAWRPTQDIFRFDPGLLSSLLDTPLSGDLPCEVLRRMPTWCVYIETPGRQWGSEAMYGFFAHLEYDTNSGREELRLLIDAEESLIPIPIHLGPWALDEAVARAIDVSRVYAAASGTSLPEGINRDVLETAEPLLSALLYLCADDAEIGDGAAKPSIPKAKRTKRGWRLFPADKPTVWDVGVRLGAALRRAQERSQGDGDGTHARPRAHIRRAHWHTFLSGAGRSERRLKWLPPIPVNVDDRDSLPAVIRREP